MGRKALGFWRAPILGLELRIAVDGYPGAEMIFVRRHCAVTSQNFNFNGVLRVFYPPYR